MFLSNSRKFFLLIGFCTLLFQACGSSQTAANKDLGPVPGSKGQFPFSTTEPDVFQADIVVTSGQTEEHWFFAKMRDKWRLDFFHGSELWMSQIRSDKLYRVDHQKKTFWETSDSGRPGGVPAPANDMIRSFFRSEEHREFDEIGRENGQIKYKVRDADAASGEVFIYIDAASGLMVKQEFTARKIENADAPVSYIYELRNYKTEVDERTFFIPESYKRSTPPETHNPDTQPNQ